MMNSIIGLTPEDFKQRQYALLKKLPENSICIIPAAAESHRSNDTNFPYRQNSDFWYLTGFNEPNAVLVLIPARSEGQIILFCQDRDPLHERWEGSRVGPIRAVEEYGFDQAFSIQQIESLLPHFMDKKENIYYPLAYQTGFDLTIINWVKQLRQQIRHGANPPYHLVDVCVLIHELRLFKSDKEIQLMQIAADISVKAHQSAMKAAFAGIYEYQLQAEIEYIFRYYNSCPAYNSIVAAGINGGILHYRDNQSKTHSGDLIVIDAGAEYYGYAADITRTFPVNKEFTTPQRQLHDLVTQAQNAALQYAKPNMPYEAGHWAAVEVLTEGLLSLGILKGSVQHNIETGAYKNYYPHKTGHWLGLDVHDVGHYQPANTAPYYCYGQTIQQARLLSKGMVFTVEPGLYIPVDDTSVHEKWRGISIRTEDDILITENGYTVLTSELARTAEEIEAFMANI